VFLDLRPAISHHRVIMARASLAILLATALAGCQVAPQPKPEAAPVALPALPPLAVEGATRYVVSAADSEVRILVFRGGPLARYGHNHVIRARSVEGEVYLARRFQDSAFELTLPVAELEVDPPAARLEEGAGFEVPPSAEAIAATRENMLGAATLDATRYPEITIRSVSLRGPAWNPDATVRIALHGTIRDVTVPIAVERCADRITTTGAMAIRASDFGITPFGVLGGGLTVQDELRIRFRIVAARP
jgi:polyisoprenoid-binding protein YceI